MKTELEIQKDFIENPELKSQIDFLKSGKMQNLSGPVFVDALVSGMRDIKYKSCSYAFNELNDNSMQAGARNIHYALMDLKKKNKVSDVFIIDDGHGMYPDMLTVAVTWGGTHRQDSRKGFGKYGFGLPTACISMSKKYHVYSKISEGDWHKVTFDFTSIEGSNEPDLSKLLSKPQKTKLPDVLKSRSRLGKIDVNNLKSGTIIHLENLDRIKPVALDKLTNDLLSDFGETYTSFLQGTKMFVNDTPVTPCDPLFVSQGMKEYSWKYNDVICITDASHYYEDTIPLQEVGDGDKRANLKIRISRLPRVFAFCEKDKDNKPTMPTMPTWKAAVEGKAQLDEKSFRFKSMKANNGLIFRRLGRKMDVKRLGYTFQNNTRYVKCEIDFHPVLDEHFDVNTTKQYVSPSEQIMKFLKDGKVFQKMRDFEDAVEEEAAKLNTEAEDFVKKQAEEGIQTKKQSEIDQEETRLNQGSDTATSEYKDRTDLAKKKKEEKIEKIAAEEDITREQAKTRYEEVYRDRPYVITKISKGQKGPMAEFEEHGRTIEVYLNQDHKFFKNVYTSKNSDESKKYWEDFLLSWADTYFTRTENERDFLSTFLAQISEQLSIKARFKKKRESENDLNTNDLDDDLSALHKDKDTKVN